MDSAGPSNSSFSLKLGNMTDAQLRQSISQLSHAASGSHYQAPFAAPTPHSQRNPYSKNVQTGSGSATPPPRTSSRKSKPAKGSNLAPAPSTPAPAAAAPPYQTQAQYPSTTSFSLPMAVPEKRRNPPRAALPTTPQALQSTYASRLRTGATLLMQPILSNSTTAPAATASSTARPRRGGIVSYADPGSGDEFPDAGEVDSDSSDFVASGGTRTAIRATRVSGRMGNYQPTGTPGPQAGGGKTELDQSYLGMVPPARFITAKPVALTKHQDYSPDAIEIQAERLSALVPIRVEFETDTHRIRDCFVWNLKETLVTPEHFAKTFISDLDLPQNPWVETVATQIRAQLEDQEGVGSMELAIDGTAEMGDEVPDCRVVLSIDVQVDNHHLLDHIEWDLRSPLTPEAFTHQLCLDLGLAGEAEPLIAHAIHEELMKHKKDAIEWGVIGGSAEPTTAGGDERGLLKDKTGLGLGWARTPKDGRGPRVLRSVWRDWPEAEEFGTRWEELTAEEVERREIERERASRRLRRETSKFQSSARTRRR